MKYRTKNVTKKFFVCIYMVMASKADIKLKQSKYRYQIWYKKANKQNINNNL